MPTPGNSDKWLKNTLVHVHGRNEIIDERELMHHLNSPFCSIYVGREKEK